ncbi:hypothetical protein [Streptomyces parvus]|uniref:hypothetical protein n=1 Tax=Streptomyces parvus TaxID=66428 RepID=UPI003639F7ED
MSDGLPSKQTVNAVGGRLQAREVVVGATLWTLDGSRVARTTVTDVTGLASHLILVDRWAARGTFRPEYHDADPVEAGWVTVESVRPRPAPGKPFTVYGYRLRPYPSFLVNGHPVRAAA